MVHGLSSAPRGRCTVCGYRTLRVGSALHTMEPMRVRAASRYCLLLSVTVCAPHHGADEGEREALLPLDERHARPRELHRIRKPEGDVLDLQRELAEWFRCIWAAGARTQRVPIEVGHTCNESSRSGEEGSSPTNLRSVLPIERTSWLSNVAPLGLMVSFISAAPRSGLPDETHRRCTESAVHRGEVHGVCGVAGACLHRAAAPLGSRSWGWPGRMRCPSS